MTKINTPQLPQTYPSIGSNNNMESLKNRNLKSGEAVDDAASGFEALLLHKMLQEMWSTTGSDGLLGENSNEAQIFRDMFNQAVADEVSKGEGIGVKKFLQKELSKQQDVASNKESDEL